MWYFAQQETRFERAGQGLWPVEPEPPLCAAAAAVRGSLSPHPPGPPSSPHQSRSSPPLRYQDCRDHCAVISFPNAACTTATPSATAPPAAALPPPPSGRPSLNHDHRDRLHSARVSQETAAAASFGRNGYRTGRPAHCLAAERGPTKPAADHSSIAATTAAALVYPPQPPPPPCLAGGAPHRTRRPASSAPPSGCGL